ISACRRDTFGDSNTIVLAAVRPSEQLPWIGWRLPSAASSQAPSSGGGFTQKHSTKKSWRAQSVSYGGASSCEPAGIQRGVAEPVLSLPKEVPPSGFKLSFHLNHGYVAKVTNERAGGVAAATSREFAS